MTFKLYKISRTLFTMSSRFEHFLGLNVSRTFKGIFICQRHYALKVLANSGFLGGKLAKMPMNPNLCLIKINSLLDDFFFQGISNFIHHSKDIQNLSSCALGRISRGQSSIQMFPSTILHAYFAKKWAQSLASRLTKMTYHLWPLQSIYLMSCKIKLKASSLDFIQLIEVIAFKQSLSNIILENPRSQHILITFLYVIASKIFGSTIEVHLQQKVARTCPSKSLTILLGLQSWCQCEQLRPSLFLVGQLGV